MQIAVLQHVAFESAGMCEDWAALRHHTLTIYPLYENVPLPELSVFDMLLVMGGPMGVYDHEQYTWMAAELALIQQAIAAGKYVVGICLGSQLIAHALGAKVYPHYVKEIGWFPVTLLPAAATLLPEHNVLMTFHWHGDTFDLPEGAQLLMSSEACPNQAFLYQHKILGLQFHLEVAEDNIRAMIEHCGHEIVPAPTIQTAAAMLAGAGYAARNKETLFLLMDRLTQYEKLAAQG